MSQETLSGGSAFTTYLEEERDEQASLTVFEDGTIKITGVLSGDEAVNLLGCASQLLYEFMRTRSLPDVVLTSDVPRHDPPVDSSNTPNTSASYDVPF